MSKSDTTPPTPHRADIAATLDRESRDRAGLHVRHQTTATAALKLCPFCGGPASLTGLGYCGPADCYDVVVRCDECDAQGATLIVDQHQPGAREFEAEVAAEAVAAWNQRSAENAG